MGNIFGKLLRGILIGILSILLLLNVWQLVSHYAFHQDPPSVLGFSPVIVLSGSMEPAFSAGDLLIIQRKENYRKDEIVTFEDRGSLTTHRIVELSAEGFTTKGDHNNAEDSGTISAGQIKGALVLIIPRIGSLFLFLRSPLGILLSAVLCLLLLFLPDVIKMWISHGKGRAD